MSGWDSDTRPATSSRSRSSDGVILRDLGPPSVCTINELRELGFSDFKVRKYCTRVLRGVYVQDKLTHGDAVRRLQHRGFVFDAVERARAYHLSNPRAIAGGFSALALARMKFFVDEQPTFFLSTLPRRSAQFGPATESTSPGNTLSLSQLRSPMENHLTCANDPSNPFLRVLKPQVACADIIAALSSRDQRIVNPNWFIPPSLKPYETRVRQIQILDATLRLLPERDRDGAEFLALARGRCDAGLLEDLLGLADPGSESPPETVMRLLLRSRLAARGYSYFTQVSIVVGDRRVTVADAVIVHRSQLHRVVTVPRPASWSRSYPCRVLAVPGVSEVSVDGSASLVGIVALMFDGLHHQRRGQRDRDSEISAVLLEVGLRTVRVTMGMLKASDHLLNRVLQLGGV